MSAAPGRLRVPPRERFAGSERIFDLEAAFAKLPRESVARHGHMQKILYRTGSTTTAIFAFEAGAGLDRYTADAEAIIHVVEGRLRVRTQGNEYELTRNQMLLVDPRVPHDIKALAPTRMLLMTVLQDARS